MIVEDGDDLVLHCYLQPGASRNEFAGEHDGALRIRIAAPPVDGKANQALIQFLAKAFAVPKSRVQIELGQSSRRKRIRIGHPQRHPDEAGYPYQRQQ